MRVSLDISADQSRLALAAKLRQRSLAESVERIRNGDPLPAPVVVELDITTFCDLACPECISGHLLNRGRFSADRVTALASEIGEAGVRGVILIGGGEPLLHPVVGSVITALTDHDVAVGLTTNGTQINRYLDIIASRVDWTRVSVDAASAQTYDLFRPRRGGSRNTFADVTANIAALANVKQGTLGFSFLLLARPASKRSGVMQHNFAELADAARLARNLGCDYIEVKPEYDFDHQLIAYPQHLRDLLLSELTEAIALESADFHVIAPMHLSRILSTGPLDQPKAYHRCPSTELRTLLTPSGAFLCPYHRGNLAARYGDPTAASFSALWNSAERRNASDRIDPSRDCRFHCIRHESNLALLNPCPDGDLVDDYDLFI